MLLPASRDGRWPSGSALLVSVVVLALAVVLAVGFDPAARSTSSSNPTPGYRLSAPATSSALDGIALALVRADRGAGAAADRRRLERRRRPGRLRGRSTHTYLALTLAVEGMVLMSLVSLDVLLFYVFFEAMLIPMYFLIGGFGGRAAVDEPR